MNSGDSTGLGGPLKKPATKPGAAKPLGGGLGGGAAGKPLGGSDAAPPAPAASAPAAPLAFEFDDAPETKPADKKPAAPASFNPFADQPVAVPAGSATTAPAPSAPGTARIEKPATGRIEKPGTARIEKPVTGRIEKPGAARIEQPVTARTAKALAADDGDIAPGLAKDLWLCPHCGAKNKPHRETCRECKKSPSDAVEKPWFLNPVIAGPIAGGLILAVVLIMWLSSVDLSLHSAGVVDAKVRASSLPTKDLDMGDSRKFTVKKTASVSGRVILATEYPVGPWLYAVVLGLGSSASDDAEFAKWSAEFEGEGYKVNAPKYAVTFLIFPEGEKPKLKAGDYLSVVGQAGVPEQDNMIVRGTDNANCWAIKVEKFETR